LNIGRGNDMTSNFIWLILAIYFEARNQHPSVQVKIGHAVMNRTITRSLSVKGVVAQKFQFPWYRQIQQGTKRVKDMDALVRSAKSADECMKQRMNGIYFYGADHFFDDSISAPSWAKKLHSLGKFGSFYFFRS
jgi:spore germination cell wall hydrolase CwlJ-like protein